MEKNSIGHYSEICQLAARTGGQIILQKRGEFSISEKAPNDLVTDADIASQTAIQEIILTEFPSHDFLGEEDLQTGHPETDSPNVKNAVSSTTDTFRWIVDPLDGTVNYIHGLQSYSVSIGLQHEGKMIAGAVFDPVLDEMYFATSQGQATLNGQPISNSGCVELSRALIAISLPSKVRKGDSELEHMIKLLEAARSIRRLGSAALNLCYVAAGRLDGYLTTSVKAWDIAAGALIAQQAGATVKHVEDRELELDDARIIAASSNKLWRQIHLQTQD